MTAVRTGLWMPCFSAAMREEGGARLGDNMPSVALHSRCCAAALACLAVGGCSLWRHDVKPEAPVAAAVVKAAPAPGSRVSAPMMAVPATPASEPLWSPATPRHLEPAAMVGQTWTFPSADPQRYGDIRLTFRKGSVEASDSGERLTGTWTVERDKLCVTLKPGAAGTACYYVTGATAAELRIRALPGGERLPLKIQ
jgi:hypothetical protein